MPAADAGRRRRPPMLAAEGGLRSQPPKLASEGDHPAAEGGLRSWLPKAASESGLRKQPPRRQPKVASEAGCRRRPPLSIAEGGRHFASINQETTDRFIPSNELLKLQEPTVDGKILHVKNEVPKRRSSWVMVSYTAPLPPDPHASMLTADIGASSNMQDFFHSQGGSAHVHHQY